MRFEQVRVTVLVDNDTSRPDLRGEHGFALWIEAGESKVLFDTGASGLVCENAAKLGIDLSEADAVVLSHGHDDHAGGLSAVAEKAPRSVLYAHPTAGAGQRGLSVVNSSHPETVAPGLRTTGEIRRITGFEPPDLTYFPDDQALFFEVEAKGLVVVVGCAHAGVVNTLKQVARLAARKRVHAVLGGMHLHDASEERLAGTVQAFRDYGLRRIAPCHCTGDRAVELFAQEFPEAFVRCHTGTVLTFDGEQAVGSMYRSERAPAPTGAGSGGTGARP